VSLPTCTLNGHNLNDGATFTVMPGATMGERVLTFDAFRSYTGQVTQTNVTEAAYIPVTIPLRVAGSDVFDLMAQIDVLNGIIAACSATTPGTLVFNGRSYTIHASPRVPLVIDQPAQIRGWTTVTVNLNRTP
jgi:hypothetical protein